jgi:cellobiose-specific phosphotransferase system component IIC
VILKSRVSESRPHMLCGILTTSERAVLSHFSVLLTSALALTLWLPFCRKDNKKQAGDKAKDNKPPLTE